MSVSACAKISFVSTEKKIVQAHYMRTEEKIKTNGNRTVSMIMCKQSHNCKIYNTFFQPLVQTQTSIF